MSVDLDKAFKLAALEEKLRGSTAYKSIVGLTVRQLMDLEKEAKEELDEILKQEAEEKAKAEAEAREKAAKAIEDAKPKVVRATAPDDEEDDRQRRY